ncbi:MAG: SatD family protein [Candidatus Zixiibacteriota bacterium]
MNKNKVFIAITGDVVQSRNVTEIALIDLKKNLTLLNRQFNPTVPFTIQAGDEIQGLMSLTGEPVLSLLWFLGIVYPLKVRWGIGRGTLDSSLRQSTAEMRGEAFEYSREALKISKKKNRIFSYLSSENNMDQINIIFGLFSGFLEDWNKMAYRRCHLYSDSKTIYKVAESEGVSTEAINKHMNRTKIRLILEAAHFLDKNIFSKSTL